MIFSARRRKRKMTLQELIENSYLETGLYKGFTTKYGKKIFWYIIPNKNGRSYRCFPIEKNGYLGYSRYINYDSKIILINK